MAGDDLFGPDGTQALQADMPLGDPLGGLVTGAGFAAGGNSAQERAEVAATRVELPDAPAAPDQAPFKQAVDKAMMTGPPTNPLRLPTLNTQQYVRPAPTVATSGFTPLSARPRPIQRPGNAGEEPVLATDDDDEIRRAMRAGLAGRDPLRRNHPILSGLVRMVVGIVFVLLLLYLVLKGSGSSGNLSGLFG